MPLEVRAAEKNDPFAVMAEPFLDISPSRSLLRRLHGRDRFGTVISMIKPLEVPSEASTPTVVDDHACAKAKEVIQTFESFGTQRARSVADETCAMNRSVGS